MEIIPVARCAIVNKGKLLLLYNVRRARYEMPGGKVKESEMLEQGARREVREETGCGVTIKKLLGTIDTESQGKTYRAHVFLASTKDEPRVMEPHTFSKLVWMPIEDYKNYTSQPGMKKVMEILMKEIL